VTSPPASAPLAHPRDAPLSYASGALPAPSPRPHEYSPADKCVKVLCVRLQCRRTRSRSSTRTETRGARRSGLTWRATACGSSATSTGVSIRERPAGADLWSFFYGRAGLNSRAPQCGSRAPPSRGSWSRVASLRRIRPRAPIGAFLRKLWKIFEWVIPRLFT